MQVQGRDVVRGVDVSDWQKSVDHQAVKDSGVSFLVAKATEGTSFAAGTYRQNRQGAAAAGLTFGAYHWLKPNLDAGDQARWFLTTTGNGQDCSFLVLDAEEAGITDTQVTTWCVTVAQATGKPVVIYCGAYTDPKTRSAEWTRYTPWLAAYPSTAENPDPSTLRAARSPAPWGYWTIWQYSSSGRVPGIQGLCDVNVADAAWFASLGSNPLGDDMTPEQAAQLQAIAAAVADTQAKVTDVQGWVKGSLASGVAQLIAAQGTDAAQLEQALRSVLSEHYDVQLTLTPKN